MMRPETTSGAILRSFAIGALTLIAGVAGLVIYVAALCQPHRVWQRVHDGRTSVVLDSGYRYATGTETIFVCAVPHAIGSIVVHEDLGCYCAPASVSAEALGRSLNGDCTVDRLRAQRTDETGACRHAHCIDPIRPGLIGP
jgi:hypothetical protein